jgi:hypothetical protein
MGAITADLLRTIPGVQLVGEGAGFDALRLVGGGMTSSLLQQVDGVAFAQLQRPIVRHGRLPDPHRSDEVFANPAGQAELGVGVGQSFELVVLPEFSFKNPITGTFEQINADVRAGKIGQRRRFTSYGNTCCFELPSQRIQACGISDLPPEKALGIRTLLVNDDPLAAIVHTEGAAGSGPVHQLQPQLARREVGPLIDVLCADTEIAERLNAMSVAPKSGLRQSRPATPLLRPHPAKI